MKQLTNDEFSKTFKLIDNILSQYDMEDNDDYILLISHLITIFETLAQFGRSGLNEMITNPEIYTEKAL